MRRLSLIGLLLCTAAIASAGKPKPAHPLTAEHETWLEDDVEHIISRDERDAFLGLTNDAARADFILAFWEARDPTPGTARNERRDAHVRRLAEADELFKIGRRPGRKTDRGRTYVQLGAPLDRTRFASSQRLHPMELWTFRTGPRSGLPQYFRLIFFRRGGGGDFELYDPVADGPEELVGGFTIRDSRPRRSRFASGSMGSVERQQALAQLEDVSDILARASLSADVSETGDMASAAVSSSANRVVGRVASYAEFEPVDRSYVARIVEGQERIEVDYSFQDMGMVAVFHGSYGVDGDGQLDYAIEIPPESLSLNRYRGRLSGSLEVVGRVVQRGSEEPVVLLDRRVDINIDESELAQVRDRPIALLDRVPLLPGAYSVDLLIRDRVSRRFGAIAGRVIVPAAAGEGLQMATPLLVSSLLGDGSDGSAPFVIGDKAFYPRSSTTMRGDEELLAVVEVAYPGGLAASSVELAHRVVCGSELVSGRQSLAIGEAGGVLVAEVRSALAGAIIGDCELQLTASAGSAEVARSLPFEVRGDATPVTATRVVLTRDRGIAATALALAEQLIRRGDEVAAIAAMQRAVDDASHAITARVRLAELHLRRSEFVLADAAIEPVVSAADAPTRALLLRALARSAMGDSKVAIATLERAVAGDESSAALNLLGEEQARVGDVTAAAAAYERSLVLEPKQPRVRAALDALRSGVP